MDRINKVYLPLVSIIIIVSYFIIGVKYSDYYNSDTAIQVLQANSFNFSTDWYFWGQDRLGSLVPLLGFLIHKIVGLSTIDALGIANHIILILLFFVYSKFLKNNLLKIALCLIIFLPATKFMELAMISHPYSGQLLFIGILYHIVSNLTGFSWDESRLQRLSILLSVAIMVSFLAIWLSDYSVLFVVVIFFKLIKEKYSEMLKLNKKAKTILLLSTLVPFCIFAFLIKLIKNKASVNGYGDSLFMSHEEFMRTLKTYSSDIIDILFFNINNKLYSVSIIGIIIFVFIYRNIILKDSRQFVLLFLLSVFPVIILKWVWLNAVMCRYYTPAYFFLWVAIIYAMDKVASINVNAVISVVVLASVQAISLISPLLNAPSPYLKLQGFRELGKCGVIGNYWFSYNIAGVQPDSIIATSNDDDQNHTRNPKLIGQILKQPHIYLIGNSWLESFPNETLFAGRMLMKVSNSEKEIGGIKLAEYKTMVDSLLDFKRQKYTYQNLFKGTGRLEIENGAEVWVADAHENNFSLYGPYITLDKGEYEVTFDTKAIAKDGFQGALAKIDICGAHGAEVLAVKELTSQDSQSDVHVLRFKIAQTTPKVEFRVFKYENSIIKTKKIVIKKL